MTNEEILENYGSYVTDWYCVEAFIKDGSFYYRYEDADPVTEPGQIHHLKITAVGAEPVSVCVKEFHEAQKGIKLK